MQRYAKPNTKVVVCAINELPTIRLDNTYNHGYIVNLAKSHEPGTHWIGIFIDTDRNGFYLDTYSLKLRSGYIKDFIKLNCNRCTYSTRQLQQLQSNVCGMYSCCFLVHMIKGYRFSDYLDKFSMNLLLNDQFVEKMYYYYIRNDLLFRKINSY